MKQILRTAAQLVLYVPLMAIIGYFSTQPRFSPIGPDEALVRVSLIHAGQRKHECRQRSAEELAKLAPNMRAALDCPRERADVLVELELDGTTVLRREVEPAGFQHDGNAVLYQRLAVPAGPHRIVVRLRDRAEGDFNYVKEQTVELDAGRVLLIDFNAAQGGFVFKS
jgi:hypothetical protein